MTGEPEIASSPPLGELATLPGEPQGPADPRGLPDIEAALERARVQALLGLDAPAPRFGRFIVKSTLGRGGMGVVLAAHDPQLDRRVAVKLLDDTDATAQAQAAVLREARSLARLSHPNVVGVYEVGDVEGMPYIAMELVEGTTLRGWLEGEGGQVPERLDVLAMFLAVGEGLLAAHEAGIVHRDFKPDNVLVGEDGRPRILDFGLSRALPRDTTDEASSTAPVKGPSVAMGVTASGVTATGVTASGVKAMGVTASGMMAGTPAYMAPEQWRGEPFDERADVFAFCVALYEALYGERPFSGDTLIALMEQVTAGSPREVPMPERVASPLHAAILRGLAREPQQRGSGMQELVEVIRDTLGRAQPGFLSESPTVILRVVAPLNLALPLAWLLAELAGWVEYRPRAWLYVSGAQIFVLGMMIRLARPSLRSAVRSPRMLNMPLVFVPLLLAHRIVTLALGGSVEMMFVFDYLVIAAAAWTIVLFVERGMWPMMVVGLGLATLGTVMPEWAPRLWVAFIMLAPTVGLFSAKRAAKGRNRAIVGDSSHLRKLRKSHERSSDFL